MKTRQQLRNLIDPTRRRVRRMTPAQMLIWAEPAAGQMYQALAAYVHSNDPGDLHEFIRGAAILAAMAEELDTRHS